MSEPRRHLTAIRIGLPEQVLAQRLGLATPLPVKATLRDEVLERLSKHTGVGRRGWLCFRAVLVLYGMEDGQERELLRSLQVEGGTWTPYYERVEEEPWDNPEPVGNALAKHLQLQWLDGQADALLDEADVLLEQLRRGRLHYRSRRLRRLVARVLRMEHGLTTIASLPGHTTALHRAEEQRWSQRFELDSRLAAVSEKLATLNAIIRSYMALGDTGNERRLIGFEVILLAIFPLFALVNVAHWNWMDMAAQWFNDLLRLFR